MEKFKKFRSIVIACVMAITILATASLLMACGGEPAKAKEAIGSYTFSTPIEIGAQGIRIMGTKTETLTLFDDGSYVLTATRNTYRTDTNDDVVIGAKIPWYSRMVIVFYGTYTVVSEEPEINELIIKLVDVNRISCSNATVMTGLVGENGEPILGDTADMVKADADKVLEALAFENLEVTLETRANEITAIIPVHTYIQ